MRLMLARMGMEAAGKLHVIFEAKQVTERFRKREFVIELADNPRYPQHVLFQLTGDRCEQLDAFREGDEVQVEFSLRGREWNAPSGETKYFNSLDCWEVRASGGGSGPSGGEEPPLPDGPPPGFDEPPF
jgi:single-strand DNA-binding protein